MYCKEGNSFQFSFLALLSSFELGIGHMGLTILQSYKEGCFALPRANTRSVMNESRWLRHTLQAPLFSTLASTSPVFFSYLNCFYMLLSPHSNTIILNRELMIVCKDDVDVSENVIWKGNFASLQSFHTGITLAKCVLSILKVNWSQRFRQR